jgi:hypothetical protein
MTVPAKASAPETAAKKKHEALLEAMKPATREVAKALKNRATQTRKAGVLYAHDVGTQLNTVAVKETVYGSKAVEQLVGYLDLNETQGFVEMSRSLATAFDRDTLSAELDSPMDNGKSLELYHFVYLGRLNSPAERRKFLKRVRTENLSVKQLLELIRGEATTQTKRTGTGRHTTVPESPMAALQKVHSLGIQFGNYVSEFSTKAFPKLSDLPEDRVDERYLAALRKTQETLKAGLDTGRVTLDQVETLLHQAEDTLKHKAEPAAEEESAPIVEEEEDLTAPLVVASDADEEEEPDEDDEDEEEEEAPDEPDDEEDEPTFRRARTSTVAKRPPAKSARA